ncbi:PH domain-containing protein [Candidatus Uhrbacteria bacterium]|nr:PH domain-containing protein [Candidatus Uhrbacteria bacterium]
MFSIRDVIQLQPNEKIELFVRRSVSAMLGQLVLAGVLIALPFFFLFSLLRSGSIGAIILCLFLAAGILVALRAFLIWDSQVLLLTNRRAVFVEQKNPWHRIVHEVALVDVQNVSFSKTWIDGLFGRGTIRLSSGGSVSALEIPDLPRVKPLAETITILKQDLNGVRTTMDGGFRMKPL